MFNQIGLPEVGIVLVIVLLIFGPKRLPAAGRALGKSMREFKDSIAGKSDEADELEAPRQSSDSQAHAAGSDEAARPSGRNGSDSAA